MKEQKLYVCDFCGTQYKDKEKARTCEKGHKVYNRISDVRYHAGVMLPDRVEVEFTDGSRRWYKL